MCLQFNVAKLSKRKPYKKNISIFTFILKVFNVIFNYIQIIQMSVYCAKYVYSVGLNF